MFLQGEMNGAFSLLCAKTAAVPVAQAAKEDQVDAHSAQAEAEIVLRAVAEVAEVAEAAEALVAANPRVREAECLRLPIACHRVRAATREIKDTSVLRLLHVSPRKRTLSSMPTSP